jgi:hypothetical protein
MQHQRVEDVRARAIVAEARPAMTRDERLKRWVDLLQAHGRRPLNALRWVEFYTQAERPRLRQDGSPIALAYADPLLRAQGLAGDTLGDAQAFFGLSEDESHQLLCDCHHLGRMTGRSTAGRIRALAGDGFFSRLRRAFM